MSNQVTTATPQMTQAAKQAENTGQELIGQFGRLLQGLEPLAGNFHGLAANAFDQAKQQAHEDIKKIVNALNTLGESVHKTGVTFASTDQQSETEINKVAQQTHLSGGVVNLLNH